MMFNFVLLGAPGAGKGTQATLLRRHYGFEHLSTGEMLRNEIAQETALGKQVQSLIGKGLLVSDEIVADLIKSRIEGNLHSKGFLFDGFPRTLEQAKILDNLLLDKQLQISALIYLDAPEEELVQRMLLRGQLEGRADDKDKSIISNRIRIYHESTKPLFDYYKAQNKCVSVAGTGSIDSIFETMCKEIDKFLHR
ncbi:adenylate kinase [Bacteroidia bacterium]|nr:adenylate kinase [Bacteroidia bacterium]